MPAPGDQHKEWANPFEEPKVKISMWTAQEIATIASKLDKQLGPEYISARAGPGGQRVHYLTAEKCITLANEVFGFNGWSSSIQNIQVDFADEHPQTQRVSIGLSVIVRVTLRDGTYHEDIGYGSIENAKGKAMAFEKAKKEGTTDGLKRALRSFGNILGNCIYDKDYVSQVVKLKAHPVKKFDQNNLHRHSDFIKKEEEVDQPPKQITAPPAKPLALLDPAESFEDLLGELDEADFCVQEDGHPDEIMLPGPASGPVAAQSRPSIAPQVNQGGRAAPSMPNARPPQTPNQGAPQRPGQTTAGPAHGQGRGQPVPQARNPSQNSSSHGAGAASTGGEAVGFFSAKAVNQLPDSSFQGDVNTQLGAPRAQQLFNPKAESPSIRKTPGIDHSSSKPLGRNGQHVAPPTSSQSQSATGNSGFAPPRPAAGNGPGSGARGNVINPNLDHTRRIGAPGGLGSPLGNRGSFRQPTMKRPPPGDANGARAALADLPANPTTKVDVGGPDGSDAKRQKMT